MFVKRDPSVSKVSGTLHILALDLVLEVPQESIAIIFSCIADLLIVVVPIILACR